MKIPGGYYIKARKIKESAIAHASPCVRETWDYLLREANHSDKKYNGFTIKRGQLFRSYKEIRDALHWKVGYRTQRYSENQMKKGMKHLTKERMITTTKEPRGILITICNYDYFQEPKNYEGTKEGTNERTNKEPTRNRGELSINKNVKNVKNETKETVAQKTVLPDWLDKKLWNDYLEHRKSMKAKLTPRAEELAIIKLGKMKDEGQNIKTVIEQTIVNGWKGLFPEKEQRNEKPAKHFGRERDKSWNEREIDSEAERINRELRERKASARQASQNTGTNTR